MSTLLVWLWSLQLETKKVTNKKSKDYADFINDGIEKDLCS